MSQKLSIEQGSGWEKFRLLTLPRWLPALGSLVNIRSYDHHVLNASCAFLESYLPASGICPMLRSFVLAVLMLVPSGLSADDSPGRRFIAADSSRKNLAIIAADGTVEWQRKIGPLHDLHVLPNGHVLFQDTWTHVLEVDPRTDRTVWEYEAKDDPSNANRRIEIHALQRLKDGSTMVVESGSARILEIAADGSILKNIPLKVTNPHPHRDTRLVRKLDNGHYLACHEGDGVVREYNATGRVVWEYEVPLFGRERTGGHGVEAFGNQCFTALRLKNGNTLIGTGNGHSVIEVTNAGQVVWSLHQNDLPGIQLAWVTSLQLRPDGQILINNCHAGPDNPQLILVDRNKNAVWTFKDFDRFGNALTNSILLD